MTVDFSGRSIDTRCSCPYDYAGDCKHIVAVLSALYEEVYLESARFCKQYAGRWIEAGNENRAIEVLEDGIETFRSTTDLRWLAADLYRERDSYCRL